MANPNLQLPLFVVVVFQGLAAFVVMRGLRDRDDLVGLGRMMPVIISFVPIVGPLVAGRTVGVGLRPTVFSMMGLVLAIGLYFTKNPVKAAATRTVPQASAPADATGKAEPAKAEGETKLADAKGADAKAPAAAKAADAKAPEPAKAVEPPAPVPAPTVPATPAAAPSGPLLPAQRPVAAPPPAVPPRPAVSPFNVPAQPAAPAEPLPAASGLLAEGRLAVSTAAGDSIEQYVGLGGSVYFAAVIAAPPGASGNGIRRLYLGGGVRNYNQQLVDRFAATPVDDSEVVPGHVFTLPSRRGGHSVLVRIDSVRKDPRNGEVQSADLEVQIR